MSDFSAMDFFKKRKEIPKGYCISCKYFYTEDNIEVCLKSDKFLIPEFRPDLTCNKWEE